MIRKALLGMILLSMMIPVALAVPNQLTYSGRLLQNGALVNSTLLMTFKIYDNLTVGNLLWSATDVSVVVNQGIYSVVLDQVSANVFAGDNAYLEVSIGAGGAETLEPRTKINSVGYALQASAVTGLSNNFPSSGNVGIGTMPNSTAKLQVGPIVNAGTDSILIGGGSGYGYALNTASTHYAFIYPSPNQINLGFSTPLAVPATPVMVIKQNGSVGIGTTNPVASLQLNGQTDSPALYVQAVSSNASGLSSVNVGMYIDKRGYVGIGTTSQLSSLLNIYGQNGSGIYLSPYNGVGKNLGGFEGSVIAFSSLAGDDTKYSAGLIMSDRNQPLIFGRYYAGYTSYTESMRINGNGYVGIGLSNPGAKLTVVNSTASTESFRVDGLSGGAMVLANNGTTWANSSVGIMGSNLFVTTSNIGIGTTNPDNKLVVNDLVGRTWANANQLKVMYSNSNTALQMGYAYQSGQYAGGRIQALDNGNGTRLLLNPDGGAVGIGTTLPGYNLQVNGNGYFTSSLLLGSTLSLPGNTVLGDTSTSGAWGGYHVLKYGSTAVSGTAIDIATLVRGYNGGLLIINGSRDNANTVWIYSYASEVNASPWPIATLISTSSSGGGGGWSMSGGSTGSWLTMTNNNGSGTAAYYRITLIN
ncbi:MAG: hypothetical protein WC838_04870 [Candidatus Margulisiibacteriota bacterium]|jgi:hypothetical protein